MLAGSEANVSQAFQSVVKDIEMFCLTPLF